MTSIVDIANYALNTLGATNITTLDENSKAARIINQRYESVRDTVFRAHPWNCLLRRAELAKESTAPEFGYANQYALPTDPFCLRVLEFSNGTLSYPQDNMTSNSGGPVFVIEGRKLLTDEGIAKIKYVGRVTDPQQYEANLTETLAAKLAMEIAYALTGSNSIVQLTASLYDQKLKEARFVDGTEGAPQRIEASEFIEARL
jgi:hypothetical protein|tara:strand:+ start:480 stop:1085 length:606 start_codon:yes stop_codon:yes gene_type:complete